MGRDTVLLRNMSWKEQREEGSENFQGVYLPLDDRARLTYRVTIQKAYLGFRVGGSCCPIRI